MKLKLLFLISLLTIICNVNLAQNVQIGNYDLQKASSSDLNKFEKSILKANTLFKLYTEKKPHKISAYFYEESQDIIFEESTTRKDHPEIYLVTPNDSKTKLDTLKIAEQFLRKLDGGTFISYDSLGYVIGYKTGWENIKTSPNTSFKTSKGKKSKLKKEIVTSKPLDQNDLSQVKKVALFDYKKTNKPLDKKNLFKYFLWSNFFHETFLFNKYSPSLGIPKWVIDFQVIDASKADEIVKCKKIKEKRKLLFLTDKYRTNNPLSIKSSSKLCTPILENEHSTYWKYIVLDMSNQMTFANENFFEMSLFVKYLKETYSENIVKEMIEWYVKSDFDVMLFATFIKSKYNKKTNIQEIKKDFYHWINSQN